MGHSQGSHRAARGSRRTEEAPAPASPRSFHEERTIVAGVRPGGLPVHDPTVLDTPLVPRQASFDAAAGRAAAARRTAARKHRGAPESLRRILPRALVVAVLAGGTSAFLAHDKAIELSVDGEPRTVHTFADDVGELLDDRGVTVGARDTVAPPPGTGLDDGDEVVVRRGTRPDAGGGARLPQRP